MNQKKRYRKNAGCYVVAVQFNLETDGFIYQKWGGEQRCKKGDWLVDNSGDIYTVDGEVFKRTYRGTGPGTYVKSTPVWAEQATKPGKVKTKEGVTDYNSGDYIVFNQDSGGDSYAVSRESFERMYEIDS
jgi:hypothetical protein